MMQRIKHFFQKRQDRRLLKYSLQMLRSLYPNLDSATRYILVKTVRDLVIEYRETWGEEDGIADFCFDRINYITITREADNGYL